MERKRDLAIVLKWVPFEERHRVVTALTENHGRISALARNSIQSRRFGGALEPFTASEWHFVERVGADLYRVEEAHARRGYENIRADFDRLSLASLLAELMLKLAPEREPCADLFRLHANALAVIDETPDLMTSGQGVVLLNGYLAKVMQWSGNQPQIAQCLGCALPIENLEPHLAITGVIADAGWLCPSCRVTETRHVRDREGQAFRHSSLRITPAALKDFHASMGAPIRHAPAHATASLREHQDLFAFIEGLLIYHVPGFSTQALKSLRFIKTGPSTASASERSS